MSARPPRRAPPARPPAAALAAIALAVGLVARPLAAAPGDAAQDAAQDAAPTVVAAMVPAVARLNRAGYRERRHCTASLIGPREVVTARHCVEGLSAGELHVLLGYDRGGFVENRRVASVASAPDWDIARLCLDEPAAIEPLDSSAARPAAGPAETRGYPRSQAHAQDTETCRLEPLAGRPQAALDCPLEQGMSGAPVSVGEGGEARVIGVASASNASMSLVVLLGALPEGGCPPSGQEAPGQEAPG